MSSERLNLDKPRHDQNTFQGRIKHFFIITNPLNLLVSDEELDRAKATVDAYRKGKEDKSLTEEQLWRAKYLSDSAFHPQTGEKLFLMGRMYFQVPGNMFITGCMMTFYQSTAAVIFWQTVNQTYNAIVNYSNRNASVEISQSQLTAAYLAATSASVATAVGLNKLIARSPSLSGGVVGRLVPLVAVAAASCINIPLMRQEELKSGITLETLEEQAVGKSSIAAAAAISQVIFSRVITSIPNMLIPPLTMYRLEKTPAFLKYPWLKAPMTVALTGICLTFTNPLSAAIFPQRKSIEVKTLEQNLQEKVKKQFPDVTKLYYNKGL
jgi:tricarboxylate carrier